MAYLILSCHTSGRVITTVHPTTTQIVHTIHMPPLSLLIFSQTNSHWFNLVLNESLILVLKFLKIKIIFSFEF